MKSERSGKVWRWKFFFLYAVLLLVLLVSAVGVLEVGVRLFVPERYWRYRVIVDDWQEDRQIGWIHKPNLDVESREDGKSFVRFRTNKDGLQPASAQERKTRFR